jgi:hypothetical protein
MGWGNLFPLFGWQPHWAPPPDQLAPPKRRTEAQGENDAKSNDEGAPDRRSQPTTQRQQSAPGTNRPLPRPQTKRRRRGRKR